MATSLVVISDTHIGSTVGLCAPDFIRDDGGVYTPSKAQQWLWNCWTDFWETVYKRVGKNELYVVLNGDAVDGPNHHGTSQSVSSNRADERRLAEQILRPVRDRADYFFMVRGTDSHVGESGESEETIAHLLGAEKDGHRYTHSSLLLELGGKTVHFMHHGRVGASLTGRGNPAAKAAAEHYYEALRFGRRPYDLLIRSDRHLFADSGITLPTRQIQTPAWQLATNFVHRVCPDEYKLADLGGILINFTGDSYDLDWIGRGRYIPTERTPWRPDNQPRRNRRRTA